MFECVRYVYGDRFHQNPPQVSLFISSMLQHFYVFFFQQNVFCAFMPYKTLLDIMAIAISAQKHR